VILWLFEIARMLGRLGHVGRFIVNANYSTIWRPYFVGFR
jgi:hypothetical protein